MNRVIHEARLGAELSGARYAAVAVSIIGCILVFVEPTAASRWVGFFQDTGMYLSVLSFAIAGSLYAVVGYHTAATHLNLATELQRTVRSPRSIVGLRMTGDLAWLLGALLIVHGAAYTRTALHSESFSVMGWSLTLLGLSSATLCYAYGMLAGSLFRRAPGLFFMAVLPYALTLYANAFLSQDLTMQHVARLVAPYIDQSWGPGLVPNHGAILLLAAYCLSFALALVGIVSWRLSLMTSHAPSTPARPPHSVVLPLAIAVLSGAIVAGGLSADDYYRPRADGYACALDGRVCAWERHSGEGIATWTTAYELVQEVLTDVDHLELRFAEVGGPTGSDYIILSAPPGTLTVSRAAALMIPEYTSRIASHACRTGYEAEANLQLLDVLSHALGSDVASVHGEVGRILDGCR